MPEFAAPGVRLAGVSVSFGPVPLFADLDLDLAGGQWTCLLGRSGIGKSTLCRIIAGLDVGAPVAGELSANDGVDLNGRVAWMAQQDLLLPWLNVIENVTLGARLRGESKPDLERARQLLERAGLKGTEAALPRTLSGGMRQRVALARTLIEDRPIVVLDEPFGAVDALTRLELQALAFELLAGRTVMLITHDPLEALRLGHRVQVLRGSPAQLGSVTTLPGDPLRPVNQPGLGELQGELLGLLA